MDITASDVIASITADVIVYITADVSASITAAFHERDDREDFTFAMCQLREREATRCGGSLVLLRGCQRRTVTQISMDLISGKTLRVLLGMFRGEGLCICGGTLVFGYQNQISVDMMSVCLRTL
jgi:hypothetical protein